MRNFLIYWLPPLLWMALIFYGSSQSTLPSPSSTLLNVVLKAGGHVVEYAVLAVLLHRAIHARFPHPAIQPLALVMVALYAASDELHQSFVPGRVASWSDFALDIMGGAGGLLLWNVAQQWRERGLPLPGRNKRKP